MLLNSLTEAVLEYQRTGIQKKTLMKRIMKELYLKPKVYFPAAPEERADRILEFLPRMERIVSRFTYSGTPFEAYLAATVKWFTRSQEERERSRKLQDAFCAEEEYRQQYSRDPAAQPDAGNLPPALPLPEKVRFEEESLRRRILLLTLKCCDFITDPMIERTAAIAGMEVAVIHDMIAKLREAMGPRMARRDALKEKRAAMYLSLCVCQNAIKREDSEAERMLLRARLARIDVRLRNLDLALARASRMPTHSEIARVTGIPKGSVDSGINYIRNQYAYLLKKDRTGYA